MSELLEKYLKRGSLDKVVFNNKLSWFVSELPEKISQICENKNLDTFANYTFQYLPKKLGCFCQALM